MIARAGNWTVGPPDPSLFNDTACSQFCPDVGSEVYCLDAQGPCPPEAG